MKVRFAQFYIEPGVNFPFSHHLARRLSQEMTAIVEPSDKFIRKYGREFELVFRISAKQSLPDNEIKGPTVFKKNKSVEYSIFLPFDVITRDADAPKSALRFLLKGVCNVFDLLEIDKANLLKEQDSLIDGICSDPTMLEEPSWDEEENNTLVRGLFEAFFEKRQGG